MLTRLEIDLFKCFKSLSLPLAPLTLLSGTNASGKSSALQTLVLLHQTMCEHEWSTRLLLNGKSIRLGTVLDVVDKINGRESFKIGVVDDEQTYSWIFTGERHELSMAVDYVKVNTEEKKQPDSLRYLLFPTNDMPLLANRLRNLTYITAERIGPREVYTLEDRQIASVVGSAGEHAISVLHLGRDEPVLDGLVVEDVINNRIHQVEARMRIFFPGCGLDIRQVPKVNAVTLGLRNSDETDFHRPINVGFGLTQVLPIVIAALSAQKEDILLIEKPPQGLALLAFTDHPSKLALPLFASKVAAGFPSPADDYVEKSLDMNELLVQNPAATFFARAEGESMINAGIFPNDILVVDRSLEPISGKIVVCALNSQLTVKRLVRENEQWVLKPENPNYPDIPLLEDLELVIWGVVTRVIHDL